MGNLPALLQQECRAGSEHILIFGLLRDVCPGDCLNHSHIHLNTATHLRELGFDSLMMGRNVIPKLFDCYKRSEASGQWCSFLSNTAHDFVMGQRVFASDLKSLRPANTHHSRKIFEFDDSYRLAGNAVRSFMKPWNAFGKAVNV